MQSIFETVHKDVLNKLALDMEIEDILSLCQTSKRFNDKICNNPSFWENLLIRDFNYRESTLDPRVKYIELFEQRKTLLKLGLQTICKGIKHKKSQPILAEIVSFLLLDERLLSPINFQRDYAQIIVVFNYLFDKIQNEGDEPISGYFSKTYNRYIKDQNKYANRLDPGKHMTPVEWQVFTEILIIFQDVVKDNYRVLKLPQLFYLADLLNRLIKRKIDYTVTWGELCSDVVD